MVRYQYTGVIALSGWLSVRQGLSQFWNSPDMWNVYESRDCRWLPADVGGQVLQFDIIE